MSRITLPTGTVTYPSCRETIAIEEPHSFFPLLDAFTHPQLSPHAQSKTDQETYKDAIDHALALGYLSEPGELAAFEMTLALHSSVPRVEAAYEYYLGSQVDRAAECGSWVDWYGHVVCDVETLRTLAGVETIDSSEDAPANRCVLLYVTPTPCS